MKELILGQIPDDFDPDKHIVVSPASFIGREHIYPDFENMNFIDGDCYSNLDELINLDKITSQQALHMVPVIAKKYNPDLYTNYSPHFWKTIYFPFLGLLVPWIYRKQILVNKILDKYKDEKLEVSIVNSSFDLEFKDIFQFIVDGLWSPDINEWVLSQFIEKRIPEHWEVKYHDLDFCSNKKLLSKLQKNISYKRVIKDRIYERFFRSFGIYGFNLWHNIFFHLLLSVKPKLRDHNTRYQAHLPATIKWQANIESIINFLLPADHRNLDLKSANTDTYKSGKIINFSNRLYYDIKSKISAAFAYENNCIVVATQHGGHNYGSAQTFEYGKNIEFNSDYFISWGSYQLDGKSQEMFIPLPSPLLSKHLNTHVTKSDKILLVGTTMHCFRNRFDSGPSEVDILAYRKNKLKFLDTLSTVKVDYRPYLGNLAGLLDWEYLKHHSNIKTMVEGDLHREMQKCNLLVLDHPGTTLNVAMAMNTPIICFWNRNHFPFNKEADKYLDKLREVGIFFDNSAEAAQKVNQLYNDFGDEIFVWWNQGNIQTLRKNWMNKYAQADKHWLWMWSKTLWKL